MPHARVYFQLEGNETHQHTSITTNTAIVVEPAGPLTNASAIRLRITNAGPSIANAMLTVRMYNGAVYSGKSYFTMGPITVPLIQGAMVTGEPRDTVTAPLDIPNTKPIPAHYTLVARLDSNVFHGTGTPTDQYSAVLMT